MIKILTENKKLIKNIVFPLLILVTYFTLAFGSIKDDSATIDEKFHLVRGVMFLETGDLRINQHHPLLFNTIAAIPVMFDEDIKTPEPRGRDWEEARKDELSFEFQELNGGQVGFTRNVLTGPRTVMILISGAFLYLFYFTMNRYFGFKFAAISTTLMLFEPTFLAHSRLVTTDVPAMWTIFFASFALFLYLRNKTNKHLILFIVTAGIALLSKYSALMAAPMWLLAIYIDAYANRESIKKFTLHSIKLTLMIGIGWLFMLTAAYQFQFGTLGEMTYGHPNKFGDAVNSVARIKRDEGQFLSTAFDWFFFKIKYPFPQYVHGFYDNVIKHNKWGHASFLLGEHSNGGWPHYFPIAYLIKEPLVTVSLSIIAALTAIWAIVSRRFKIPYFKKEIDLVPTKFKVSTLGLKYEHLALILPPLFLTYLSLTSKLNLGVRHLLPLMPFIMMMIAWFVQKYILDLKYGKIIIATLISLTALSVVSQYPHFISYFNESIGSRQNAYKYLRDSNLDWRQNRIRVDRAAKSYGDRYIGTNINDDDKEGVIIVGYGQLYARPGRQSETLAVIARLYENGQIKPAGYVSNSHVIFDLSKEDVKLIRDQLED